jgi:hypothetical protein
MLLEQFGHGQDLRGAKANHEPTSFNHEAGSGCSAALN